MTTMSHADQAVEHTKEEQDNLLANRVATTGMAGSLVATLFSGISKGKVAHLIHPFAAFAFIGFTIWHTYLNVKDK